MDIECGGFLFVSNFDAGNLGKVEQVIHADSEAEDADFEFNIWTRPDCAGTEFENGNRTWFYFGIKGGSPYSLLKLNIMNLNKQSKMYAQGMSPVYRVCPGRPRWERIREKPSFCVENNEFMLSFKHRLQDTYRGTVYFAFTYPFSYSDLQNYLNSLELIHRLKVNYRLYSRADDIYYHREVLCHSYEKRKVDLITISSYHNITPLREPRLHLLFPDQSHPRPFRFQDKKVIFLSARVHPGETPSSFVLNGMLSLLVTRDDPIAQVLRRHFVFKVIPMLNPDGVYAGNYRTDTRGVNLNRVYTNPSPSLHPSIFGARSVLRYCHHGYEILEKVESCCGDGKISQIEDRVSILSLERPHHGESNNNYDVHIGNQSEVLMTLRDGNCANENAVTKTGITSAVGVGRVVTDPMDSGLFLYIDMHGHASKKGIFMYGNHFDEVNDNVECMLLPKIISINSQHFHFESCNFSERNMYLRDRKDGSSREGCGRVSVLKTTGLVRSYTLECNYNTGKILNQIPPAQREERRAPPPSSPPKYSPIIYEEVGRAILMSILDLKGLHPNSRLMNSQHRSVAGVREWLRVRSLAEAALRNQPSNNQQVVKVVRAESLRRGPRTSGSSMATAVAVLGAARAAGLRSKRPKLEAEPPPVPPLPPNRLEKRNKRPRKKLKPK